MDFLQLQRHSQNALITHTQDRQYGEHKRYFDNKEQVQRLYHAPPEKQHFVKIFVTKFLRWSEWQRNIVLCGITERCSRELLRVLVTVLSPYFQRKAKRFKSFRQEKRKKERDDVLERPVIQSTFSHNEGSKHKTDEDSSFMGKNDRPTQITQNTIPTMEEPNSDVSSNACGKGTLFEAENSNQERTEEIFIDCAEKDKKISFKEKEAPVTPPKPCNEEGGVDIEPSNDVQVKRNDLGQLSSQPPIEGRRSLQFDINNNYLLTQHDANDLPSAKEKPELKNTAVVFDTEPAREADDPKYRGGKKTSGVVTSSRNCKKKTKTVHSHAAAVIGNVPSSKVLLPQIDEQKLEKLGPFMASTCKDKVDVHSIKNQQWWLPSKDCSCLVKPTRSALLEGFNNDVNDLWKVFVYWSNAEKGDCILDICAACTVRELKHFADCVRQRLKEKDDFERLSDDILLKIFEHMDAATLCIASQVCSRWKMLGNSEFLWENKAISHAQKFGCERLLKEEADHGAWKSKTWKEIYGDLVGISANEEVLNNVLTRVKVKEKEAVGYPNNRSGPMPHEKPNLKGVKMSQPADRKDSAPGVSNNIFSVQEPWKKKHTLPVLTTVDATLMGPLHAQPQSTQRPSIKKELFAGTVSIVNRNLKADASDSSNIERNDVVIDLRKTPVQARNELITPEKQTTEDESRSFSVVSVPGVFPVKQVKNLRGHFGGVMALHSDAKRVMTGAGDHIVRVWDVRSGVHITALEGHKGGVRSILFDDKYIYSGSWDMTIIVWDVVKFVAVDTLYGHTDCVSCLEMTDNLLISGSHDRSIMIWEKSTRTLLHTLTGHKGPINCLALADSENLYSGGTDGTIRHWNIQMGNSCRSFSSCNESFNTISVCGDLIATGSASGKVLFWNKRRKKCEASIKAHEGPLNALCFVIPRFLTAGNDGLIKEWDLSTCACLRTLKGHKGHVNCLRASGWRIISGSDDNTVRIWNLENHGYKSG